MPLTDIQVRNFKPAETPFRKSDGGGLFVEVRPNGSKLWRLAYRFHGKQKLMSFGSYPETTLANAREKRLAAKSLLSNGKDPMEQAKAEQERRRALSEDTFGRIADELMEKGRKDGLARRTLEKKSWILEMAKSDLAELPIKQITAQEVLAVLRKTESKGKYETARRMRSVIGQVFRYAIATARADNDPTFALRDALTKSRTVHMAALTDWEEFTGLVRAIWSFDGGAPQTRAALKLMTLLYPRPGELRGAHWSEFDLTAASWEIPAERTKMRRKHVKPLSVPARSILQELKNLSISDEFVVPSSWVKDKPISENTMNTALRRMGFTKEECTSHGFRASASSLLNESGKWSEGAIETELAHVGSDEVRRAYNRTRYWEERVSMAQWWAEKIMTVTTR